MINAKQIHFIGIGGIGMSALAKLMKSRGVIVTGSDVVVESKIVESLKLDGISVQKGHDAKHVSDKVDLVVYSAAVPEENPERVFARGRSVQEMSYADFLGEVSKEFSTIVVSGTHGKSTTTAMLGLILQAAGYDPTALVGSLVPGFEKGNLRIGKGRFFVVEGCEYRANFLSLAPEMIVLTNIEEDHLDFYRDLNHIRDTFQEFVDKLKGKGLLIWNADDQESNKLKLPRNVSCGIKTKSDYRALDRVIENGKQSSKIVRHDSDRDEVIGTITLSIPGEYNMKNALAATTAALELGVPFEVIQKTLATFAGIWRRFERVGMWHGADVISDYGHHPTAIRETLKAAREFFPGRRIVLCFQPHQHSRTKELFNGFVEALREADVLIVPEIYEVKGRTEAHDVSSRDITNEIEGSYFAKDFKDADRLIRENVKEGDVLIIQGAGDVDDLARRLIQS